MTGHCTWFVSRRNDPQQGLYTPTEQEGATMPHGHYPDMERM
jgi:hypothetical protein